MENLQDYSEVIVHGTLKLTRGESTSYARSCFFLPVKAGRFKVSIQGSEAHYSSPRENLPSGSYTAFEVAVFENDRWVKVRRRFPDAPAVDCFENGDCPVAGYVPVSEVIDLLEYLARWK